METGTTVTDAVVDTADFGTALVAEPTATLEAPTLVTEELLVEDVSIDGMCGVY